MRYILLFWATPLVLLWGWFFLSYYDWNFGFLFLSREFHDFAFQIYGQIQSLTGEGRLSGIVLLALPPVLFVVMYRLNPDYVMVLFTDEIGKLMLAGAVFMQLAGAFVIKKIINIKV